MSSLVTAPERSAPGDSRARRRMRAPRFRANADLAFALGLAGALSALALLTSGGTDLGPNTWIQIVLLLLGAGAAALALLKGAPGPAWGAITLLLFAAVAALTAISIAWSVQPDSSWLEANRTVSYVAAFGTAMVLARLFPGRWRGVVGGIALLATAMSSYALLVKVFPGTFESQVTFGRLRLPLDYWNATGLIGALGLPACLWAGARRERAAALRGLSVPAISICAAVVVLSYSRSAALAAIVGVVCWFAVVPVRLRGALLLALGLAGAAVISAWAILHHALTHDYIALPARTSAGHPFGVVLLATIIVTTILGMAAAVRMDRVALAPQTRRRLGTWLLSAAIAVPLAVAILGLATSSRGPTGEISHVWSTLTSQRSTVGDQPARFGKLDSTRARDWSEGVKVGEHALLKGVGALGFATARGRYSRDSYNVQHAHSYVVQTFADFGLIGLALNLALLVAWCFATARTLGSRAGPSNSSPSAERSSERAGLLTLLCVVVVFGVQSAIDWTWFVPGIALPALICAGWLAGRGPLDAPVGRQRARSRTPWAGAAVAGVAALAVIAAWAIWQPLRSTDADAAAITALSKGDTRTALSNARAAIARDPLAAPPRWELSAIYEALGEKAAARAQLVKGVDVQPQNYETWQQLGAYDLQHGQARLALSELRKALSLDMDSTATKALIQQATAALAAVPTASGASGSK